MKTPEKQATILFLIQGNKILLAMKKRGFGAGRWNGVGGKPEGDETIDQTAVRECQEEINVTPIDFSQVGHINFYFPAAKSDWNQHVSVYLCTKWQGDPIETEEMKPEWFDTNNVPYDEMWSDDKYWLPNVIAGEYIQADVTFGDDDEVLTHEVIAKPIA